MSDNESSSPAQSPSHSTSRSQTNHRRTPSPVGEQSHNSRSTKPVLRVDREKPSFGGAFGGVRGWWDQNYTSVYKVVGGVLVLSAGWYLYSQYGSSSDSNAEMGTAIKAPSFHGFP